MTKFLQCVCIHTQLSLSFLFILCTSGMRLSLDTLIFPPEQYNNKYKAHIGYDHYISWSWRICKCAVRLLKLQTDNKNGENGSFSLKKVEHV